MSTLLLLLIGTLAAILSADSYNRDDRVWTVVGILVTIVSFSAAFMTINS